MRTTARQTAGAYALLFPALLLFAVFFGIPMVLAFVISFKHIDMAQGILESPWVGVQNFHDLFANALVAERIGRAFRNTLLFTVCFVPVNLALSLALASLVHSLSEKRQAFYRAAFYLPAVASAIVFAMIWKALYDPNFGLLNQAIGVFGLGPINWTGDPDWAIWSVILAAICAGPGGNILIYLAALGSVPASSREAALVEGANPLQSWWFVTLPHLRPVTLYLLVLNTIGSFQVFELVFVLTSGGPAGSSTVLVYEIYDLAFKQGRYGPAGALSLILLAIVVSVAIVQFKVLGGDVTAATRPSRIGAFFGVLDDAVGRGFGLLGGWFARLRPARAPRVRMRSPLLREAPTHLMLLPLALLFLAPMAWMFVAAVTPSAYLQASPPRISLANMELGNYRTLLERAEHIVRWFWNSAYLALTITVVQVLLSCLTGYVFARLEFPGRRALFALFLCSIMVPFQALLIPLFLVVAVGFRSVLGLDIMNTHWAILLPALCSPVGIFLMRQYIAGLPRDLDEAARIDGCGDFGVWLRVILPLCKPLLGAWAILTFTGAWRSFFWPFVVLGSEVLFTLEVGLQSLQQQNAQDFGLVMAGATLSAVPMIVVFFIFQKQIVAGLTFGAVKG